MATILFCLCCESDAQWDHYVEKARKNLLCSNNLFGRGVQSALTEKKKRQGRHEKRNMDKTELGVDLKKRDIREEQGPTYAALTNKKKD